VKGREWYQSPEVAASYDRKRFSRGGQVIDRRERRAVFDALGRVEGRRVLEVACGTGRFTAALATRGAEVVAVDVSEAMLDRARARVAAAGVADRVSFVRGDAAGLPFPDDAFETVVGVRFLHLAADPARFLAELARVARESVVVDTFDRRSVRVAYTWLLPMGSRLYDDEEVRRLFAAAGLDPVAVDRAFVVPFGVYRLLPVGLAGALHGLDRRVVRTAPGRALASVSYWSARVVDAAGAAPVDAPTGATARATADGGPCEAPGTDARGASRDHGGDDGTDDDPAVAPDGDDEVDDDGADGRV
jgi:ubiquinone/menaquinone biosynthesis C-methylase UbiE